MSTNKILKNIWYFAGRVAYTFAHPFFYWLIDESNRVRIALIVGDEVLVVKTWVSDGNFRLPGGGIKPGETWQKACQRDLQEELGIKVKKNQLKSLEIYKNRERGGEFEIRLVECRLESKPAIKAHPVEITNYKWLGLDDKKVVASSVWGKILKPNAKK